MEKLDEEIRYRLREIKNWVFVFGGLVASMVAMLVFNAINDTAFLWFALLFGILALGFVVRDIYDSLKHRKYKKEQLKTNKVE